VKKLDSAKQLPTGSVFGELGNYWAEIAESNSTEKQISFVKSILPPKGLILDLACGTGRHSIQLCRAGYDVIGLDLSGSLLQIAKRNAMKVGSNCDFVKASMLFVPFRSDIFAGIVSLDTSFGYLVSEGEDIQSLREVKRILNKQGVLVLDVFNRDKFAERFGRGFSFRFRFWFSMFRLLVRFPKLCGLVARLFKWRQYSGFRLLQKRIVNPKFDELRDLWLVRDKNNSSLSMFVHIVRLYGLIQLKNLLNQALLVIEQVYGNYRAEEYSNTSNRLIIIAKQVQ
jgi:SAM-dependent methyltransferase